MDYEKSGDELTKYRQGSKKIRKTGWKARWIVR